MTEAGLEQAASPGTPLVAVLTHALQQVAVVVEALLAVALVAWLRVHALALLADLCPKQDAFVDVCVTKGNVSALCFTRSFGSLG